MTETGTSGPNLVLVLVVGILFGTGVILLLERSLSRVLVGILLLGNGANLLILLGGRAGGAPLVGVTEPERMSDPLTQALVLTAIVITLGMSAFLLAMAYRNWQLTGNDEVQDDLEDQLIVRRAERDEGPGADDAASNAESDGDEAAETESGDHGPRTEPANGDNAATAGTAGTTGREGPRP